MEIKQLKYFVVAADVGSFSEAAKLLYTTQSSVSKIIASLENELGYALFKRESKGISLTYEGKKFHIKASKLVADFDVIQNESVSSKSQMVKISTNHSSWLANCFSKFYDMKRNSDLCYCIHADTTANIINRIRLFQDEVGFVYVFPDTKLQFEYELKKYNLNFERLKAVDGMIYFQPDDVKTDRQYSDDVINSLKYIQSEQDEYLRYGSWRTIEGESVNISKDIAVITNSDYVMHAMLERNGLANLSSDSFNSFESGIRPGIKLLNENGSIEFGVITNTQEHISKEASEFIDFIKEELAIRN